MKGLNVVAVKRSLEGLLYGRPADYLKLSSADQLSSSLLGFRLIDLDFESKPRSATIERLYRLIHAVMALEEQRSEILTGKSL
jgi:hypothetical protein